MRGRLVLTGCYLSYWMLCEDFKAKKGEAAKLLLTLKNSLQFFSPTQATQGRRGAEGGVLK